MKVNGFVSIVFWANSACRIVSLKTIGGLVSRNVEEGEREYDCWRQGAFCRWRFSGQRGATIEVGMTRQERKAWIANYSYDKNYSKTMEPVRDPVKGFRWRRFTNFCYARAIIRYFSNLRACSSLGNTTCKHFLAVSSRERCMSKLYAKF